MDPELNDEFPQLRSDLTEAERAAADKGADDAFRLAFGDDAPGTPEPAAAPAPAAPSSKESTPEPQGKSSGEIEDDPFKDLNPKVRDLLAEIPDLKRNAQALHGRLAPTQQKLAQVERELAEARRLLAERTPAAAPPAPEASELEQRVRGELPEVADLIREQVAKALGTVREPAAAPAPPAAAPAAPEPTVEEDPLREQKARLTQAHADWIETMNSTDYKLFVAAQGADFQERVMSSSDPDVVSDSLTKFKTHRDQAQRRTPESDDAARRNNRTQRGVVPSGRTPPGDPGAMTEHEAFLTAFNAP